MIGRSVPRTVVHETIAELGGGRFSHWTGEGFIFSSSDNTNPQSTGRRYWIVKPK